MPTETQGRRYSAEPDDPERFTQEFNRFYSSFAPLYSKLLDIIPLWRNWIEQALPYLTGPRVLEVACGTGHLMAGYAADFSAFAIDLNPSMARQSKKRLLRMELVAQIQIANVEGLPYSAATFDTVVSTMAFSGFPNGRRALEEMRRVLKPGGRLVLVDVGFPNNGNLAGTLLAGFWQMTGDVIRDLPGLFDDLGWTCTDQEVGGFGSVHLYTATR
jgi:ubiquinone/menaquinone biosynthesis C-methylase UbiE